MIQHWLALEGIPDEVALALREKEYLMKLPWLAEEGIPDEAALAVPKKESWKHR